MILKPPTSIIPIRIFIPRWNGFVERIQSISRLSSPQPSAISDADDTNKPSEPLPTAGNHIQNPIIPSPGPSSSDSSAPSRTNLANEVPAIVETIIDADRPRGDGHSTSGGLLEHSSAINNASDPLVKTSGLETSLSHQLTEVSTSSLYTVQRSDGQLGGYYSQSRRRCPNFAKSTRGTRIVLKSSLLSDRSFLFSNYLSTPSQASHKSDPTSGMNSAFTMTLAAMATVSTSLKRRLVPPPGSTFSAL